MASIQAAAKTQKITCLLNLVKGWKLLLVSLWPLIKIHLLTSTIIIRTLEYRLLPVFLSIYICLNTSLRASARIAISK